MNTKLTEQGTQLFHEYLETLRTNALEPIPLHLLTAPLSSSPTGLERSFQERPFSSRQDCGQHVVEIMAGIEPRHFDADAGFWNALALRWFDQLCPADKYGRRQPAKHYNYILSNDYRHRPRHAIRTAWQLVHQHGHNARFLQAKPMNIRGELVEQFMGRQYYLCCEGALTAASKVYMNPTNGSFKRGATGRGAGTITRYISWLLQVKQTYDLHTINGEDLYDMLPGEFDRFKSMN